MKGKMIRSFVLTLCALLAGMPSASLRAQDQKTRPRTVGQQQQQPAQPAPAGDKIKERLEPDDPSAPPRSDVPADTLAHRQEAISEEEQQIVPYYNNYLATYRLGPEDVITVNVFDLPKYSRAGITVPPNGVIELPLIPEGVFVVGKTTRQVGDEIAKRLDEYVIDPKVTVSLEKAQSAVYTVLGDVASPGVRPMTHRISVYEAVALAGGVLQTGDKSKVTVARRGPDGYIQLSRVNLSAVRKGKTPDNFYLNPGDQVLVPGNKLKSIQQVISYVSFANFFRVFLPF